MGIGAGQGSRRVASHSAQRVDTPLGPAVDCSNAMQFSVLVLLSISQETVDDDLFFSSVSFLSRFFSFLCTRSSKTPCKCLLEPLAKTTPQNSNPRKPHTKKAGRCYLSNSDQVRTSLFVFLAPLAPWFWFSGSGKQAA
jgi:hypothetical protein